MYQSIDPSTRRLKNCISETLIKNKNKRKKKTKDYVTTPLLRTTAPTTPTVWTAPWGCVSTASTTHNCTYTLSADGVSSAYGVWSSCGGVPYATTSDGDVGGNAAAATAARGCWVW